MEKNVRKCVEAQKKRVLTEEVSSRLLFDLWIFGAQMLQRERRLAPPAAPAQAHLLSFLSTKAYYNAANNALLFLRPTPPVPPPACAALRSSININVQKINALALVALWAFVVRVRRSSSPAVTRGMCWCYSQRRALLSPFFCQPCLQYIHGLFSLTSFLRTVGPHA